jgi:RHS repeat-associated protein
VGGAWRTFTLTKDATRRITKATDAMSEETTYTYDPTTGLVKTATDRRGKVTTLNYDTHGNVTSVVDANNQTWSMTYDTVGRLLIRTSPIAGTTVTYTYDVEDRITRVTDAAGKFWDFTYDAMDNLLTEKTPLASTTTTYTYDSRDRRITETDPLNNTTSYAYNGRSLVTFITDPASRVTTFEYDNARRRTKITQPPAAAGGASIVTEFTYNLAGELTSVKDAKNQVTQFSWEPATRTATTTFPDNSTEITEYNEAGEAVEFTNRSGQVQTRTYNANGWMTAKNCPTCGASFTYNKEGNLTQVVDANTGTYTWTYDNRNQVLTSVQPGGTTGGSKTISYTYDNAGRPLTLTYPDGTTITYTHNSRDLVTNIQSSALGGFAFSYDDAQRRTGLTFPNNHTGAYTYDNASRPTGLTWNTNAPALIASQSLTWNNVGNITSISATNGLSGTRNYTYDQINRLTARTTTGALNSTHPALTWNLDAVGNRTSIVLNGTTTTYSLNSTQLNQYSTVGGSSLTWDTRGNLLTDGTRTLTYDADNRLATAAASGTTATYTYDFAHRLARRSQTGGGEIRYLYDQNWNVIATIAGTNGALLQKWIHGPSVDEVLAQVGSTSATTYYLTKDHLGSTTALVSAQTNTVSERYTYDEFGAVQVWNSSNQPVSTAPLTRYLFTGREYDSTVGLYHYRHRWYHPGLGRFISPDPLGVLETVNLYTYVSSSPLTILDPSGLSDWEWNKWDFLPPRFIVHFVYDVEYAIVSTCYSIKNLTNALDQAADGNSPGITVPLLCDAANVATNVPGTSMTLPAPTTLGEAVISAGSTVISNAPQ